MSRLFKRWARDWLGADREEGRLRATFVETIAAGGHLRGLSGLMLDVGSRDGACAEMLLKRLEKAPAGSGGPWSVILADANASYLARAGGKFKSVRLDAETQVWPFERGSASCVVLNQLLEHLKDPFHVLGEADRVLRTGGALLIGVPNLGGLLNRLYLLFGRQPMAMEFPGPHVRGFTFKALTGFLLTNDNFKLERAFGACFYPLPPPLSEYAGRMWPSNAAYMFFVLKKTADSQPSAWLKGRETGETVFARRG